MNIRRTDRQSKLLLAVTPGRDASYGFVACPTSPILSPVTPESKKGKK